MVDSMHLDVCIILLATKVTQNYLHAKMLNNVFYFVICCASQGKTVNQKLFNVQCSVLIWFYEWRYVHGPWIRRIPHWMFVFFHTFSSYLRYTKFRWMLCSFYQLFSFYFRFSISFHFVIKWISLFLAQWYSFILSVSWVKHENVSQNNRIRSALVMQHTGESARKF